jgi:Family of unknown function (DUF6167)
MSRALWFVAGAATSAYALTKARRAAEALTPDGLRDRLAGLSLGAHLFGEELRTEMSARETELRERLGLRLDGPTEIGAAAAAPHQLMRKGNT